MDRINTFAFAGVQKYVKSVTDGEMFQNNPINFSAFAERIFQKAISIKNETTNLLSKEAKEFILEAEKHTALRAKPVCPAVFERNKMMEATQYESYFSS